MKMLVILGTVGAFLSLAAAVHAGGDAKGVSPGWAEDQAMQILILFGAVALYLGINGYQTVGNELSNEVIVGGSDMSPSEIQKAASEAGLPDTIDLPTCDVVDKSIDTGTEARCFAKYMRIHALEASGGLTYAQMGRYQSASNPDDPAGTSDETAAAKDDSGQPISNGARNLWVTETALATALNVSYMAEQLSIFSIVVGIALVLTGIGLVILALAVFGRTGPETEAPALV